jgi:hypothetical protein
VLLEILKGSLLNKNTQQAIDSVDNDIAKEEREALIAEGQTQGF